VAGAGGFSPDVLVSVFSVFVVDPSGVVVVVFFVVPVLSEQPMRAGENKPSISKATITRFMFVPFVE
jgi:hypothetical protein